MHIIITLELAFSLKSDVFGSSISNARGVVGAW